MHKKTTLNLTVMMVILLTVIFCFPVFSAKAASDSESSAETKIENEMEIVKIEIIKAPDRTLYFEGECFDPNGMKVIAFYSSGAEAEISNYTVEPAGALTSDTEKITVAFEGKTAEQKITVTNKNGWICQDGIWYYFENNSLAKDKWVQDSNGWCYLDSSGRIFKNGWAKDSKGWCYIENGYLVNQSKWIQDSSGWCYIDSSGHWYTKPGWIKDSKGWCFIGGNGYRMQQGWLQDSNGWAFVENGYWVDHYRWVKDSGGWYQIDDSGYWNCQPALESIPDEGIKVSFLDVGQAEAILIQQGGSAMLIDAGYKETSSQVVDYIREQDIGKLDYIIATHPHSDHIGGLADIIDSFDVGKIYMPRVSVKSDELDNIKAAMERKNIKKTIPYLGETFKLGEAVCTVFGPVNSTYAPLDGEPDGLNTFSIVLKITYKDNSFLFTGDAHVCNEIGMIKAGFDLSADVLKVGHHGCDTSTSKEFLDAVNPSFAVISAGRDNIWGIPTREVLTKLKDKNIETFRTDINGTVVCTGDGSRICFNCDPPEPSIGWVSKDGKWYYYRSNGTMVTGWITFNGKEYYFYPDGTLATNTITPDGYVVGEDGSWLGTQISLGA